MSEPELTLLPCQVSEVSGVLCMAMYCRLSIFLMFKFKLNCDVYYDY